MSDEPKKQNFLQGTALLAAATVIVKILGALYKIPLTKILGVSGIGYFSTAYDIYTFFVLISTTGLPVAMSRMISEASAAGEQRQVQRIYQVAQRIFFIVGLIGTLFMLLGCKLLAHLTQENAVYAIACLSPCVLLICMMSTYRGFFQGRSNMLPTSVSQVLEAVVKLVAGIALALYSMRLWENDAIAAGAAILGVTLSCVVSVIYLWTRLRKSYRCVPSVGQPPLSRRQTAKELLAIAVPITIGAAGLQLLNLLELGIYVKNLESVLADPANDSALISEIRQQFSQKNLADTLKGIYNTAQTVYNMPMAFLSPITIAIIPAITEHLTKKNRRGARATAESAARVTGLICLPCAVGLIVLSEPVMALLYGYGGAQLQLASTLMKLLAVCIVFNAVILLTNAIMQSHGHPTLPVINMFIGGALKLVAVYILTRNPRIGIYGVPVSSLLCYVTITVLNFFTMRRCIRNCPTIVNNMSRSALASVVMGLIVYGCHYGMRTILGIGSNVLLCGVPIVVGVAVYFVTAIKFKAITHEDCLLLPKGDQLAKKLKL